MTSEAGKANANLERGPQGGMAWSALGHARPLAQACFGRFVEVAGIPVRIPGTWSIRMSVVAGNLRMHRLMDAIVTRGATVIDVGANIGYNAIYASRSVGPGGRVVAIEPAVDNVAVMNENVGRSHLENIVVHAVAAGRERERRELFLRGEVSAVNSLFPDSCYAAVTGVAQVPVIPLDELVENAPRLVKIDVEGAELDVLDGMTRLLRTPDIHLIVEWHPVLQEAAGYAPDALPRRLFAEGFALRAAGHMRVTRLAPDDISGLAVRLKQSRRPVELVAHR